MNDHDYCTITEREINQHVTNNFATNSPNILPVTPQEAVENENIALNQLNSDKFEEASAATESINNQADSTSNLSQVPFCQTAVASSRNEQTSSRIDEPIPRRNFEEKLEETNLIQPVSNKNEVDDNIGEYFFETDHLALRGNEDYLALLKTIVILEGQRTKAIKDLDRLYQAQEEILSNPIEFVEKLQRKGDLNLPNAQVLAPLPIIDWDKYLKSFSPHAFNHRHMTRNKPLDMTKTAADVITSLSTDTTNILGKQGADGRSHSFNQSWSNEEQKRLEELLDVYPPEEVESRRWEKIAQALGNRSRQQVASRVQKYFIKLTKAGIPVPGRTPNIGNYIKKSYGHRHQRLNHLLFQPSTFFASIEPPVLMNDNDDDTMSSYTSNSIDGDDLDDRRNDCSDEETIPMELRESSEYKEYKMLQQFRKNKAQSEGLAIHVGFMCKECECDPIIGTRWHCLECGSTDLCNSCVNSANGNKSHDSSHQMQPIATVTASYVDTDYTRFVNGNYSYLDPNYMPMT